MVQIKCLTKKINNTVILEDINLTLERGHIYGIVGRNGSGKTMLFRAIAGLIRPTAGEIWIDDKLLHRDIESPSNLGLLIENVGLYPEFSALKNLQLLAKFHTKVTTNELKTVICKVGLDPDDKRPIKKYSLGMKQKIALAQAIMEKPNLLLLDEPTNSLDEGSMETIRELIREERNRGALVMIASHNKEDIQELCDQTYFMDAGRIFS